MRAPLRLFAGLAATLLLSSACGSEVTAHANGAGGAAGTTNTGAAGGSGGAGASAEGGSTGTGGGGPVLCNPNLVNCAMPAPACPPGEVPSTEGGCWGPCVPVLSCATEESCDNCAWGFCAEYTAWTIEYRCVLPTLQCSALACSCLAPYLCPEPYDACTDGSPGGPVVSCGCPAC